MSSHPASNFLELASEQRIDIISRLYQEKSRLSDLKNILGATAPEISRNLSRLSSAGLITKIDGLYSLTPFGRVIYNQIPTLKFMSKNKEFFEKHDFGNLPLKFVRQLGSLEDCQHIKSVVKVLEQWKEIYSNSEKFIYNILTEVLYSSDFIKPIFQKAKNGIQIKSIFSESAVVSKDRKKIIYKQVRKLISNGQIKRKMIASPQVLVILNEKEACVMFPSNGEPDISNMFYGTKPEFHEWCQDFFDYCWEKSDSFQESKLIE